MEETQTHFIENVDGETERLKYEYFVEKNLKLRGRGHELIFYSYIQCHVV